MKAQQRLDGMGIGTIAELLGKDIHKLDQIKDPSKYVVRAANKETARVNE